MPVKLLFIAVSGDLASDFTTIAAFVAELGEEVARLFAQVLVVCDCQGLIERQLFAIDGVKLPSNASKQKSGTRADFEREAAKMEAAVKSMMARQAAADAAPPEGDEARATRSRERLTREAAQIRQWLAENLEERQGAKGTTRLSNRNDNESAKMATGKGVIQGYTGVAAVDGQHQIIVAAQAQAQAHGTGSEHELLLPVVEATAPSRNSKTVVCADAGYHSEANLKGLAEDGSHCLCPAGKKLYSNGSNCTVNGYAAMKFRGAERDCLPCELRSRCLRKPDTTKTRQVSSCNRLFPASREAVG